MFAIYIFADPPEFSDGFEIHLFCKGKVKGALVLFSIKSHRSLDVSDPFLAYRLFTDLFVIYIRKFEEWTMQQ